MAICAREHKRIALTDGCLHDKGDAGLSVQAERAFFVGNQQELLVKKKNPSLVFKREVPPSFVPISAKAQLQE